MAAPCFLKVRSTAAAQARTQLVRGKAQVKRGTFEQDPVVGWLVVVIPWASRLVPIYLAPRSDGREG